MLAAMYVHCMCRNTGRVRWNYVVSNLVQVLASLFYMYYIFERFCIPMFRDFTSDYVTPRRLIVSIFGCILPGTLVLFIGKFPLSLSVLCVCVHLHSYSCEAKFMQEHRVARLWEVARFDFLLPCN